MQTDGSAMLIRILEEKHAPHKAVCRNAKLQRKKKRQMEHRRLI